MQEYWCGIVGSAVFVFDPDIQSSTDEAITLFSFVHDRPVKLDKGIVKSRIKACKDESKTKDALKRFQSWKKFYRSELSAINEALPFDTAAFLRNVQDGKIKASWGRKAHCYNCGISLMGKRGNICEKCFWIVCNCGACGCGWSRRTG